MNSSNDLQASSIAIIGMAARLPRANDLDEFWENLCSGNEAVREFSDDELLAAGVDPRRLASPNYVKTGIELEDIDLFDAGFFGYTPREAELIDPQHRVFLECAWEALEDAGWHPERGTRRVGVFAGSGLNNYGLYRSMLNPGEVFSWTELQKSLFLEKDYLTTRVSYKLNLTGPSVTMQTACSTSLVAVHMACQSLLSGESDMALAGGVSIRIPQVAGYMHEEGGPVSADGHCRAFDAEADGMVLGSGGGIVVLKRLEDAVADRDHIRAVIRATCINNDGAAKAGYTAPSVGAQAEAIAEAHALAGVSADDVTYVEAHGTGTQLGDPVEIAGLTKAFRRTSGRNGFCSIGSLKANIGHLDVAAGVAGLIKLVLCLEHRTLPPSVNFTRSNPHIDFESSPFFVQQSLSPWQPPSGSRIAGVSSFGIGGTNAHAVVEEAPPVRKESSGRDAGLITISARSPLALEAATDRLASYLEAHAELSLSDVSYTLGTGRAEFDYRRSLVARDVQDAAILLHSKSLDVSRTQPAGPVVFMFPGQGAQYVGMGAGLYRSEPVFREAIDRCSELLSPVLKRDLREILYPHDRNSTDFEGLIRETWITQPALFAVEYALSMLWKSWGITPSLMIGHSVGEYVAACLAGVFTLEDALTLVARRGRLMNEMQPGAMLAVRSSPDDLCECLNDDLEIATVNSPRTCVVSGSFEAISELADVLESRDIMCKRLQTSHAFHSRMMEPALAPFRDAVRHVAVRAPAISFVSNVTGRIIRTDEAADPEYWVKHLREPVRFSEGLEEVFHEANPILLEVGPGRTLSGFARQQPQGRSAAAVLSSLGGAREERGDTETVFESLGRLWCMGVAPDWDAFHSHSAGSKVSLPTYPFERKRYWNMPDLADGALSGCGDSGVVAGNGVAGYQKTPCENATHASARKASRETEAERSHTEPATTEAALEQIWMELLGYDSIKWSADFFDLGGDSLLATKVLALIQNDLNCKLTLKQFFETPVIAELASVIDRSGGSSGSSRMTEEELLKKAGMV